MKRAKLTLTALILTGAGALAATAALGPQEPEVIEIAVAAQALDACRETLAQVAQIPVRSDSGLPVFFQPDSDLPIVRCVVR